MTDIDNSRIEIRDDAEETAYLVLVDGSEVGRAEYRAFEDRRVFTHTEVDDAYSGKGLANMLVRFALDDMRQRGVSIVPLCPFFAAYIRRHPEYDDLVDHALTTQLKERR
jgi:predicted GNAT family acetyltransferase